MSNSMRSRLLGVASVAVGFLVAIGIGQFERAELAEAAGQSVAVVLSVGGLLWGNRSRRWFWLFMIGVAFLHVLAVCMIPWPSHRLSKGDALVGLADFALVFSAGLWFQRRVEKNGRTVLVD